MCLEAGKNKVMKEEMKKFFTHIKTGLHFLSVGLVGNKMSNDTNCWWVQGKRGFVIVRRQTDEHHLSGGQSDVL